MSQSSLFRQYTVIARKQKALSLSSSYPFCCYSSSSRINNSTIISSSPVLIKQVNVEKTPITAALWNIRKEQLQEIKNTVDNSDVCSINNGVHDIAPVKSVINYQFASDQHLRDTYVDSKGNFLCGKLLEDLDSMAGNIAFTHCTTHMSSKSNAGRQTPALVTASVDSIVQEKESISANCNYILAGQVVWTGKSSLDVIVELHQDVGGEQVKLLETNSTTRVLSSLFTYVARDRATGKAVAINKVIATNVREEEVYSRREKLSIDRKAKTIVDEAEDKLYKDSITDLIDQGRAMIDMPAIANRNGVLMRSTALENTFITQPQMTNTGGRVFGGLLMHKAFDLAEATSHMFAGLKEVEA